MVYNTLVALLVRGPALSKNLTTQGYHFRVVLKNGATTLDQNNT